MKPSIADGLGVLPRTTGAALPRLSRMFFPSIADGQPPHYSPNLPIQAGFPEKMAFIQDKLSIFRQPFIADGIARLSRMVFNLIHRFRLSRMKPPFIADVSDRLSRIAFPSFADKNSPQSQ